MGGFELDLEPNGVDVGGASFEFPCHLGGKHAAVQKPVERCLGGIIAPSDARAVACLAHQFAHRVQEVDVVAGEIVDAPECGERRQFQSVVADQPSDHSPVLLFDVAGVILGVGSPPREGDALLGAVANQQAIDEFSAVVAIQAQNGERQISLQAL